MIAFVLWLSPIWLQQGVCFDVRVNKFGFEYVILALKKSTQFVSKICDQFINILRFDCPGFRGAMYWGFVSIVIYQTMRHVMFCHISSPHINLWLVKLTTSPTPHPYVSIVLIHWSHPISISIRQVCLLPVFPTSFYLQEVSVQHIVGVLHLLSYIMQVCTYMQSIRHVHIL